MNGLEAALLIAVTIAAIVVRHALYGERPQCPWGNDECPNPSAPEGYGYHRACMEVERDWRWPDLDPRYTRERRHRGVWIGRRRFRIYE